RGAAGRHQCGAVPVQNGRRLLQRAEPGKARFEHLVGARAFTGHVDHILLVVPAKAGTQGPPLVACSWIPAFAGMTVNDSIFPSRALWVKPALLASGGA